MANLKRLKIKRNIVQGLALLLGNANLPGFVNGTIYQGPLKRVCLPGLNCYSCPGALGACPIGSLQNGLADPFWRIPFYVLGLLSLFGLVLGRFICGWLCPFGWFQELLHKIRSPKLNLAKSHARLHKTLLWGKTAMLSGLVILTPLLLRVLTGYGIPAFCTYVCPSGTLMAGIPLLSANEGLRGLAGWLFDSNTHIRTGAGQAFRRYVSGLPRTVNLRPVRLVGEYAVQDSVGGANALVLTAAVLNNGEVTAGGDVRVRFYLGDPDLGGTQIGSDQFIRGLAGGAIPRLVQVNWEDAPSGVWDVVVVVDPANVVAETDEQDNRLLGRVSVPAS